MQKMPEEILAAAQFERLETLMEQKTEAALRTAQAAEETLELQRQQTADTAVALELQRQEATEQHEKLILLTQLSQMMTGMRHDLDMLEDMVTAITGPLREDRVAREIMLQFIGVMVARMASGDDSAQVAKLLLAIEHTRGGKMPDISFNVTGPVGQAIGTVGGDANLTTTTITPTDVVQQAVTLAGQGDEISANHLLDSVGADALDVLMAGASEPTNPIAAAMRMAGVIIQKVSGKWRANKI